MHWFFSLGFEIAGHRFTLGQIAVAVAVMTLSILLSRALRRVLNRRLFAPRLVEEGLQASIGSLLHYVIVTVGLFTALSVAGFDLSTFALVAGALGVGIGFGLQNIVQNFFSGLILLFERPVRVGDVIEIAAVRGVVRKIGLRSTVVETVDGAEVMVPNSRLIADAVTNWTLGSREVRLVVPVSVAEGAAPERVIEVLAAAAGTVETGLEDPRPSAVAVGFAPGALRFEVRLWLADAERVPAARSHLVVAVAESLREAGIPLEPRAG